MKAKDFLKLYDENLNEKISKNLSSELKRDLLEWTCPKCHASDLPDENQECPECGFKLEKKQICDDRIRKTWENIYDKVFTRIKGKLMEGDLQGTNTLRFVTKLREMGIIRRLRSGRFIEVLKIPKEFVVSAFIEGKDGMKRLRKMAWRRKQKSEFQIRPYQKLA